MAELKRRGVNTVIISQPYILRNGRGADNYNTLRDKGLLLARHHRLAPGSDYMGRRGRYV